MRQHGFKAKGFKRLLACGVAAVAAAAMLLPGVANAGGGAGSGGSGSATGAGDGTIKWTYKDSFGAPTNAAVTTALQGMGMNVVGSDAATAIDQATSGAVNECKSRFAAQHPGSGDGDCRLVSVGAIYTPSTNNSFTGHVAGFTSDQWASAWNDETLNKTYTYQGAAYTTKDLFEDGTTTINSLVAREAQKDVSIIVVVLNKYEPPVGYDLSLSTTQQAPAGLVVGSTNAVSDMIHANNNGSPTAEDVNADVTLHYSGQPDGYAPAGQAVKTGKIHSNGDSLSPSFTPTDLGMSHWQEGSYRFDVHVGKQGRMKADADHNGSTDAAEQWNVTSVAPEAPSKSVQDGTSANGMKNVTTISSNTGRGGYAMNFNDTLNPNGLNYTVDGMKVWDATSNSDASSSFRMNWNQSAHTVSAQHDPNMGELPVAHDLRFSFGVTVHDPDVNKISDQATVKWNTRAAVATPQYEFPTRNPKPDKAWTTDPNEALATEDPSHGNNAGADNKTFVPGDRVSSVVNGTLPKGLVQDLSQYSLTDDWTGAAQYVDFPNGNAKVYVDGVDRTGDFTITTNGSVTTAVANPSILNGSAHQANDRKVKLVLDGTFKQETTAVDAIGMSNKGGENWNGQGADTNTPSVLVRSPKPDKAWTTDPNASMATSDPDHTNNVGSDNRMFVPGDQVSTTVNGYMPRNLAKDLSQYSISDDWSNAARYADFPNGNAKVYVDGVDRTGDFTITTDGGVTTANANASILNGSAHQANDRKVKLVLNGTFKVETDARALIDGIMNKGSEQWNHKTAATNTPVIQVRSPKPDKAWTTDPNASMATSDPDHTNAVGSDSRMFVPGDEVSTVVNGILPRNLAKDLNRYTITDDWSNAARYADFPNSGVKVFVAGVDRTGDFTITTSNGVTTATAGPAVLNGSGKQDSDRAVKLVLDGTFKLETDAHVLIDGIMNKGSEQWNNKTADTNQPTVQVRSPNPDKAWVKDTPEALKTDDSNHTNDVAADGKTYVTGDDAVVVVNGVLPKNLAKDLTQYSITDDWDSASQYVDFPNENVKVYVDGVDRTGDFTITTNGHVTTAQAKPVVLNGSGKQQNDRKVKLVLVGRMIKDVDAHTTATIVNKGSEQWNRKSAATNEPQVHVWSPNPDKSWVKLGTDGKWQLVIDPSKTNQTGADNLTFLDGDQLGAVVNLPITDPSSLEYGVNNLVLTDDYGKADYMVDPQGSSTVRVYLAPATDSSQSSVNAINNVAGSDVTEHFKVTRQGTAITATADGEWLKELSKHQGPVQVTMLVPFVANYANGGAAAQVRKDFGKQPGEEMSFCTDPQGHDLLNAADITVNRQDKDTNLPKVCGYIPPVKKAVLGEASQGGGQEDIDGKAVYPGQKVEYKLDTQPHLPASLAYDVQTVVLTDKYDQYLTPDKQTLEVMDMNEGSYIPKSKYTTQWDDNAHQVAVNITDRDLIHQWRASGAPRLQLRFEGRVNEDAPTTHNINNQWVLTLDNSLTPSNVVFNIPPALNPVKHDFQSQKQGDPTISIDGKTLLLGDTGNYVIDLDATQSNPAYRVWKLGIVDDFDEQYLTVDQNGITVTGDDGRDYTAKFNIQVKDGVLYAFAKQVDTLVPATGETVKGEPQPADLEAYATSDTHNPLADPAIDQALLGQHYHITMPYTVRKVTDGYVVKNKATQIENNVRKTTNEVSNPLKPINPAKDVVVKVGGESANGSSIYKGNTFLYQLDSSILPANRAYPKVNDWNIVDKLDPAFDEYTGQWAVYATRDLYSDGHVIADKGSRIAGSGFDSTKLGGDMFTLEASSDGTITISATPAYRALISADAAHEQGWRAYVQVKRVKVTDRHENQFVETMNGKVMTSNVVWTRTPDMTPSIHIEKWDKSSGWPNGDRDDSKDALHMLSDSTDIVFTITNTSNNDGGYGAVYKASDIKLDGADHTIAGDGEVTDLQYPANWNTLVLHPGEHVDVYGRLHGVTKNHTDRVKITATPLVSCPVPEDNPFGNTKGEKPAAADSHNQVNVDGEKPAAADSHNQVNVDGEKPAAADSHNQVNVDGEKPAVTDSRNRVNVDGRSLCEDTKVGSNADDWNGQTVPVIAPVTTAVLAQTGSSVLLVVLVLAGFAAAGAGLLLWRRRDMDARMEFATRVCQPIMAKSGFPEPSPSHCKDLVLLPRSDESDKGPDTAE